MIVEILVFVTCWNGVALGELVPGTATGYTTLPGYGYVGDTQVILQEYHFLYISNIQIQSK